MHVGAVQGALIITGTAVLAAIVHAVLGARAARCDKAWALACFVVALVLLGLALLVFFRTISPVVGYGILCVALAGRALFGQLQDERVRRHRVASLTPRPAVETIPAVWVATAGASVLMLAPYVILGEQRAAALMVGVCALVIAGVAWRMASAPVQLKGEDIQSERMGDRASRFRSAGLHAVVAIGTIFVFISFVSGNSPVVLPFQHTLREVVSVTWAGLAAWVILYWQRLDRLSSAS